MITEEEIQRAIGRRIRQRRIDLGLTQDELARALGYKWRSSINKIELGERNLTQSKIKDIADALGTTPAYIMGWEEAFDNQFHFPANTDDALLKMLGAEILSDEERQLLEHFRSLNSPGQGKLLEYAEDLAGNDKYKK